MKPARFRCSATGIVRLGVGRGAETLVGKDSHLDRPAVRTPLQQCDSRDCARREIREGYGDAQREKRESRREIRRELRDYDDGR